MEEPSVKFHPACRQLPEFSTGLILDKPHAKTFTNSLVGTLLLGMRSQTIAFNALLSKKCKKEFLSISRVSWSICNLCVRN